MKLPIYNFEVYQGNDEIFILKFDEVDSEGNLSSADLTGCEFVIAVKSDLLGDILFELDTDNGYIASGIVDFKGDFEPSEVKPYALRVHFPHEYTERMSAPKYMYDLFSIHEDGMREVLLRGEVRVARSVAYGRTHSRHY